MSDGFEFDLRGLVAQINNLERKVLPKAQAGTLNTIAFNVRKDLLKHADDSIEGGPSAFKRRGFVVDRAMPTTVNMASAVKILPTQARYLRYIIDGGVRHAGDPGAGQYDIMVEGAETTEQGNVKRGFLKKTAKSAKAERIKRTRRGTRERSCRQPGRTRLRSSGKSRERASPVRFSPRSTAFAATGSAPIPTIGRWT